MSDQRPQSRLMVLMFTDIVGSVDMRRRLGDSAAAKIISKHDELFRRTVGAFSYAEILKDLGDGFLARFSSASDAVHAALHFQSVLHSEGWDGENVQARVGLHLGEVSELEIESTTGKAKLSGLAVDMTARVMGLALPGQILMTRAAFDNARQYVREHQTTDDSGAPAVTRKWMAHGRYQFKGAEEPVEVFEVGEIGVAPLQVPPDSEKARRAVAADQEETLGWRPAVGLEIPDRKNWILDRKLGEGGFGEVWLGEHTQSKAVRVFKFCFDAERLRSFKRELMLFRLLRDALGDRNDIAKLYEVQIDHPPFYLEFEFTEDGSLLEWSLSQGGIGRVSLATRLELVAKTAVAVAAAHSVGVLHKDIKPGNVLIYRGADGLPAPRLTDFGIGDLTDPSQLAKRNIMMTGMASEFVENTTSGGATTRIYAPPEVLIGRPFTIQGDVYALGILLYQMVIGDLERPVAQGWERDIADPLLREDIARCIEGQESKRLGSAKELAERLQNLPTRRKIRRRRKIAKIGAFASVALFAMLSIGVVFFVRERAAKILQQEEARKATAVKDFMVDMFAAVDPRQSPTDGPNVRVVDKFNQAIRLLDDGRMTDDPEVEYAVRWALGNSYKALWSFDAAHTQLKKVLDHNRSRLEAGDRSAKAMIDLAQSLEDFGAVRWFQGKFEDAEALFTESWELRKVACGEESLECASSMNYLAAALDRMEGRQAEAEVLYRRTMAIREKLATGPMRVDLLARIRNNLGTCLRSQGKHKEAAQLISEAVDMMQAKYGEEHVDVGNGKSTLGLCYLALTRFVEAERTLRESLAIKRKVQGDTHSSLAVTLEGLANAYRAQNKLAEAIEAMDARADVYSANARHVEAERVLREALATREEALGADHWQLVENRSRLGVCLLEQGNMEEADELLVGSFDTLRQRDGVDDSIMIAIVRRLEKLIETYSGNGHEGRAVELRAMLNK